MKKEIPLTELDDPEMLSCIAIMNENKRQYEAYKASKEKLETICKSNLGSESLNCVLTALNGVQYSLQYICSKESYHTEESKYEAIKKAQQALEVAQTLEIGSVRTPQRFTIK